ncbi:unnamed protein product, partial [Onchocerca ochengi]|uniref:EB1 C-terminal domain-containing protein n=1 Tax=Onchocerca ochengi TaxID=42157 RepID=A0A182EHB1_ONCOC
MSKQREEIISQQFMKQFDRLISDVNVQLKILEAKINVIPKSHSSQATVAYNNTSSMGKFSMLKVVDENPSSDASSSTIDLSSIRQDVSTQLAEIDMELMRLEQNVIKTEMRIQEDVEAEEIGIEFPIARIIDYMTAIKLAMHKQQMLTKELHRIVLNNENFEKEAQLLMRDFVIWTKEKREDA